MLDQRPVDAAKNVVADGPAVRRRRAGHAVELVGLWEVGVGRGDDGPRVPVPLLDQRLPIVVGAVVREVVANSPAVRRRCASHAVELVVLRGADVGRGDDGPRAPVPLLDQRILVAAVVAIGANGRAVRRRGAGYAMELVGLRAAGVGRGDDGPGAPVPVLDECLIGAVDVVADGPAVRRRRAGHAAELATAVLGEVTMVHELPSQCSMLLPPTAQQSDAEAQVTPLSGPLVLGEVTMVHELPSHRSMSVW